MRLYAAQLNITWENKPATHARLLSLLQTTPPAPHSLLVLPEMFATGFSMNAKAISETDNPLTTPFLQQLATDYRIAILAGLVTTSPDNRGLNQAVAFSPTGQEISRYTKIHPFTFAQESAHYAPGTAIQSFRCNDITVTPFLCYDLRFPELFRPAARQTHLFAILANWPTARLDHWLTLLRARAIENQAYVVGVNRIGADPHTTYPGHSLILNPKGETLAQADSTEQLLSAQIDLPSLYQYRQHFPALQDMHPPVNPM